MPVPILVMLSITLSVLGFISLIGWLFERNDAIKSIHGGFPVICLLLGAMFSSWFYAYVNTPWKYEPDRRLPIQKLDDCYLAIDKSNGVMYNVLREFGRVPKDNEEFLVKSPKVQFYKGVFPLERRVTYELVEKK